MASSSTTSLTNETNSTFSRYSTLKAFNFMSKVKESKAPRPPPKDLCHIPPKSYSDTLSIPPASPMSPYHQPSFSMRNSPNPSQSTLSLISSAASMRSGTVDTPHPQRPGRLKPKVSGLFAFVKRGNKSAKSLEPEQLPSPAEDSGISGPWNFQHNIHVDEGFVGLPPSWTTQLAAAGFSKEEIAALQARRVGARSPAPSYLYNDRPDTPNLPPLTAPASSLPIRPSPRTSSLHRTYSNASLHSNLRRSPTSPIPPNPLPNLSSSPSSASLRSNRTATTNSSRHPLSQNGHSQTIQPAMHESSSSISLTLASQSEVMDSQMSDQAHPESILVASPVGYEGPSTPPRRPFHIVNASPNISSPPPAYSQSDTAYTLDKKVISNGTQQSQTSIAPAENEPNSTQATPSRRQPSIDSSGRMTPNRRISIIRNKRNSVLPPRLSLNRDNSLDLSLWSAQLLSGISSSSLSSDVGSSRFSTERSKSPLSSSSTDVTSPDSQPSSFKSPSKFRPTPSFTLPPNPQAGRRISRYLPPSRSVPPIIVHEDEPLDEGDESNGTPPPPSGWAEPATSARISPTSPQRSEVNSAFRSPKASDRRESRIRQSAVTQDGSDDDDQANSLLHIGDARDSHSNRFSNRSSSSTLSTTTITPYSEGAQIVRNVSVVRRAGAYVIDKAALRIGPRQGATSQRESVLSMTSRPPVGGQHANHPSSPMSLHFGSSEEGSGSGSVTSSSPSQDHPTPTTDLEADSPLKYYMGSTVTPSPSTMSFKTKAPVHLLVSTTDTFGGTKEVTEVREQEILDGYYVGGDEELYNEDGTNRDMDAGGSDGERLQRPTIAISSTGRSNVPPSISITTPCDGTPLTPLPRYPGWLSEVVKPLEEFIDEAVEPRDYYIDLQEIAEGESGSVFAAQLANRNLRPLRLAPRLKALDQENLDKREPVAVAIKSVVIVPSGSPKLFELERELKLMKGKTHENLLGMDAVYVDLVEDSLWVRMELMERSLADVVSLVECGLMLHDRMIARFANDILQALQYLQQHNIAHRDVRSDNLLLNLHGVLKLADFSAAVQVPPSSPMCTDIVGVAYWQAPEVRIPPYDALKVDVWSLGATIWEMSEAEPPFARSQQLQDRWPTLSKPKLFSPAFHDFLKLCSEPAALRPDAATLCKHPFMKNICGRGVIIQLLAQCMTIEKQQYQFEEDS
ncbi:hypothetical protein AX17_005444 [Amanita inopinata Kibby_2008]|nr:hypothetical protein AX17_005444 [Amanita inopinata Kibby_2008]